MSDTCTRAPPGPSGATNARGWPDLLRKERFGALTYRRASSTFAAWTANEARLLLAATEGSVVDAYARAPTAWGVDEDRFAALVAGWRADGLLDDAWRCRARVVDEERAPGALVGPLVTHVQLTRACNLTCRHCYVDVTPKPTPDETTTDDVLGLFADLERLGAPVVVLAGGEPLIRRDLPTLLDGLARHRLDAWLCTNATIVDEARAEMLAASPLRGVSASLDGADAATHDALRGDGRFAHALRGVRRLVDAGCPDVQLRVTATRANAGALAALAPIARDLGVHKVVVKPFRQSGHAIEAAELLIDRVAYRRAVDAARAAWPDDVPVDFGDGMPQRPAAWTRIIPAFGCVGGTTSVSVLHDGTVTGCGSVLGADEWTLRAHGFARAWREAPGVTRWRAFAGNDECRACGNFAACGGGCRARAVGAGLGVDDPDPWARCSEDDERMRARASRRGALRVLG